MEIESFLSLGSMKLRDLPPDLRVYELSLAFRKVNRAMQLLTEAREIIEGKER